MKIYTTHQAAALLNYKNAASIRKILERDKQRDKDKRRFPNAEKPGHDWFIPECDLIKKS
jgi:hypothetical protein